MASGCFDRASAGNSSRPMNFAARRRSIPAAMATSATTVTALERELLDAARGGDEDAYRRLVEPHRGELHAHCYRMLGSVHDAEDALQDALLRAWRGLPRFEGRSSLRSWLYRIATNACLNADRAPAQAGAADRPRPARGSPRRRPAAPLVESTWVEPYPDERLGLEDGRAAPEARYERREGVELAFVAALQHLPPNQRAVLILREVLGFSGQEIAEALETTVAAVNSALQRARKAVDERLPERSQQATLRALGDQRLREIVERYMDAMARGDVDAVVSHAGRGRRVVDAAAGALVSRRRRDRGLPGHRAAQRRLALAPRAARSASGQAAVGSYVWDAKRRHLSCVRARRADPARRPDRRDHVLHHRTTQLRDGDDFLQLARLPGRPRAGGSRTSRPSACPTGWTERQLRGGLGAGQARARAADQRLRAADRDVQPPGDRLVRRRRRARGRRARSAGARAGA